MEEVIAVNVQLIVTAGFPSSTRIDGMGVVDQEFAGNTGAGDAFTSGLLYGIHEGWDKGKCLKFASAAAAISLGSMTCTDAMREEKYILDYMETRPLKK